MSQDIFELVWSGYDSSSHYLFRHSNKTKEQFHEDVRFMIKKYAKLYMAMNCPSIQRGKISNGYHWVDIQDWMEFIVEKMPELSYEVIKPNRVVYSGSLMYPDDRERVEWNAMLGDELFGAIMGHNKKTSEWLDNAR